MTSYLITAFSIAGVFIIVGSAYYVLTGLTGQFALSQAAYMALGASVCAYFARDINDSPAGKGFDFGVAFLIAVCITAIIGAVCGLLTVRLNGAQNITASLIISTIILYIIANTQSLLNADGKIVVNKHINFGSQDFNNLKLAGYQFSSESSVLLLIIIAVLIVVIYTVNISKSPLGRSMRAVRDNPRAAMTCAVPVNHTIVNAHFIAALFSGAAGALYVYLFPLLTIDPLDPIFGAFGVTFALLIFIFAFTTGFKNYWVMILSVAIFVIAISLLNNYSDDISLLSAQDGLILPVQLLSVIAGVLVIVGLHFRARAVRKSL